MAYLKRHLGDVLASIFRDLSSSHIVRASHHPLQSPQLLKDFLTRLGIELSEGQATAQNLFLHLSKDEKSNARRLEECRKMRLACTPVQLRTFRFIITTILAEARRFVGESHPQASEVFDQDFKILLETYDEGLLLDLDLSFLP